jgi:undecaprenyl-diphosphatase
LNDYILSVLLGIVEGLTEFLPVSSTAHLRLVEAMLHVDLTSPYWKMYTIVIQLGAIFALVLLFTGRILEFFRTFPQGENGDRTVLTHPLSLTAIAFVCTAVPSLLLSKLIGKHLESLRLMAFALLIGGIVMWVVDAMSVRRDLKTKDVEQMSLFQAIWIGLWEVTSAVFPGVSRSMSTIAAGQAVGMTRTAALEFSFLLSIPVMIAATGYEFVRTIHPKQIPGEETLVPWAWWSGFCSGCGGTVLLFSRSIASSWALCCWPLAPNFWELEVGGVMTLFKTSFLCLAGTVLSTAALAASLVQTGTLKDLQTVGSTTKKQKHQQYDLVVDTSTNEYVCRTKLGSSVKPTQFVVGSTLEFKVNGQNGEATNTSGNKVKCAIVRVAASTPAQSSPPQ